MDRQIFRLLSFALIGMMPALLLCTGVVVADQPLPVIEMRFIPAETPVHYTPGGNGQPAELQIFADGTVKVSTPDRTAMARMPREQLETLVDELCREKKLAQLNSRQLQSDIQAEGLRLALSSFVPGAEDTVIRIRTSQQQIEVRCHATGLLAGRFPQVKSLQSMLAAQERLQNIRALVLLGDGRRANELAARASESLQAQVPGATAMTARDLSMVHTLPDGTCMVQFCRRECSPTSAAQLIIVSLMESPGEQPRVTIMSGDSVVQ